MKTKNIMLMPLGTKISGLEKNRYKYKIKEVEKTLAFESEVSV